MVEINPVFSIEPADILLNTTWEHGRPKCVAEVWRYIENPVTGGKHLSVTNIVEMYRGKCVGPEEAE